MRKTKTVTSRPQQREIIDAVVCDICKAEDRYADEHGTDGVGWNCDTYETLETTVSIAEGTNYPECGHRDYMYFDICPKCFKEKLIPALEQMGAKPHAKTVDW